MRERGSVCDAPRDGVGAGRPVTRCTTGNDGFTHMIPLYLCVNDRPMQEILFHSKVHNSIDFKFRFLKSASHNKLECI